MVYILVMFIVLTIGFGILGKVLYNGKVYYDWKDVLGMFLMISAVICFAFSIVVFAKII